MQLGEKITVLRLESVESGEFNIFRFRGGIVAKLEDSGARFGLEGFEMGFGSFELLM